MSFTFQQAYEVAKVLCRELKPATERMIVGGSMRRRKEIVNDLELIFIPKFVRDETDFFSNKSLADEVIDRLITENILSKRTNSKGIATWGEQNKLALHVESGLPVDLFATNAANWFNYLVCRTGPSELNMKIACLARDKGWEWNPCGEGFTNIEDGSIFKAASEEDVFKFVGLKFKEPKDRGTIELA